MAGGRRTGKDKEPAFEEALRRLETIVERLESGDLPLEESLRLFEEGVGLTRLCAGRLDEAQRRIEALTRTEDGLRLQPFEDGVRDDGDDEGDDTDDDGTDR